MYLIEHFSRLQQDGREDTVSVFLPNVAEEAQSPETMEAIASFMRMAATFAKQALVQNRPQNLEMGCRVLNRAMQDCARDDRRKGDPPGDV